MDKELQHKAAAHHEAGHAVMACLTGNQIRERGVSLDGVVGYCDARWRQAPPLFSSVWAQCPPEVRPDVRREVYADVLEHCAGWAAEHLWHGRGNRSQFEDFEFSLCERDWDWLELGDIEFTDPMQNAWQLDALAHCERRGEQSVVRRYRLLEQLTYRILEKHWQLVEEVAEALFKKKALTAEEVEAVVGELWGVYSPVRQLR